MKLLFFILCIMFFSNTILQAQEEQREEQKKEKVEKVEKVEKAPKKIPFRAITKEEYEKMRAKEKTQPPPPDIALFQSRTAPISRDILTTNRDFYQTVKGNAAIDKGLILENLDLNSMSRVEIADNADAIVILQPLDVYTAKLSYYTTDGQLLWEKNIGFTTPGFDLSRMLLYHEVSDDGKRIVVYSIQDEAMSIVGIYDENGQPISDLHSFLYMSPDGKYFYKEEEGYHGYPDIFNSNLVPINFQPNDLYHHDKSLYNYHYRYRIFEDDIIVLLIQEFHKPQQQPSKRLKFSRNKRPNKRVINNQKLIIYNLNKQQTVFQIKAMTNDGEYDRISFSDGMMDLRNGQFVSILQKSHGQKLELFMVDLKSKVSNKLYFETLDPFALSFDGNFLWINEIDRLSTTDFQRKYSIWDTQQNQFVIQQRPLSLIGEKEFPPSIQTFSIDGGHINIIFKSYESVGNPIWIISQDGHSLQKLYGWLKLSQNRFYLPVVNDGDNSKIDILKVSGEVIK